MSIADILGVILGYLTGSLSPSYFLGKLNNIDIRKVGTKNAGTMNVLQTLGVLPAVPTAVFDTGKGLLAMFIAQKIGAGFPFIQISGFAAVTGHILPPYLRFRGGQGVATATGIMLFYLIKYLQINPEFIYMLALLSVIVIFFIFITQKGEITGIVVLPLLGCSIFIHFPDNIYNIYICIIIIHILSVNIYNTVSQRLFQIKSETFKTYWWRVAFRPLAVIFAIFYHFSSQKKTIIFVGLVGLFFLLVDLARFIYVRSDETKMKPIFKKDESRRFSSMTMFLISAFIIVLVFQKEIAITSLIFLIFGDIFSKIFGLAFGRHKIFNKTIEGFLAYFSATLICGYFIFIMFKLHPLMLCLGGLTAAFSEIMPLGIDDNFTVGLLSGAVMTLTRLLLL